MECSCGRNLVRRKSCGKMDALLLRQVTMISILVLIIPLCAAQSNKPLEYTIQEEIAPYTRVGNVMEGAKLNEKYDEDVLDALEFRFRSSTGHAQYFTIELESGIIRTSRRIDRESVCPYSDTCDLNLDVTVRPLQYFQIIKVTVHVEDINDNVPTFPVSAGDKMRLDITETTMPGALFSLPSAEDMDSGSYSVQTYQMRGDADKFELKVTGHFDGSKDVRLKLKEKLDREEKDHYSIQIVATDGGMPPQSGRLDVDVIVSDANDNNPRFDNYTYEAQIYENLPAGTTIIRVHATDPDYGPNGQVVYSLDANTEDNFGNLFSVNEQTGEVIIVGTIDFELKNVYHLTVIASDLGLNSLPAFTKVIVHVLDKNDHAPQITINALTISGDGQVKENEPKGTFVAHVAVSDPDLGINGEFSCSILGNRFKLQKLQPDGREYKITTNYVFDREKQTEEMVTLQCKDNGRPSKTSTQHLKVVIVDANDHTPELPRAPYFAFLKENNTVDELIVKINATDKDTGKNAAIKYRLEAMADTPDDLVSMDLISGEIRATSIFDHEKRQHYQYLIIAADQADESRTATATLNLTIVDDNDEYPVFSKRSYSFDLNENEPANTELGRVHATDADSFPYNKILFSIDTQKSNTDAFDIDTQSGKIITNRPLDRELKDTYHLVVVASNEGFPHINATVNVTVYILDKNDNPPSILFPNPKNNTIPISNRVPRGYLVTRIEALDVDLAQNSKLFFDIANGNEDNLFMIDHLTGALSVAAESFRKIEHKIMKLVIIVKDDGQPEKISIADLSVEIDKNVPFELASAHTGLNLFEGSNLMIFIGAIAGFIMVLVIIIISVFCFRARQKRDKKAHQYNCRLEASKTLSNGSINKDGLHSSSCSENGSDQSIDNVHVIGLKTKERVKKEVTFSLDMDDAFVDKLPAYVPLRTNDNTKVIENPHAHGADDARERTTEAPPPQHAVRPHHERARPVGPHERGRRPHPPHQDRRHPHGAGAWVQDQAQARANGEKPVHLTEVDLEMHDMLNLSQTTDHDSESGCSGSYTDSGRGPSEEGDNFVMHDPFYSGESKNGGAVKSDSPSTSPASKESDISPPPGVDKTHMNIPHLDSPHTPTAPIGGANLRLKTFAPLPRDANTPHGLVNNLNKDSEVNGNQLPPYPSNCVHSNHTAPRTWGDTRNNKPYNTNNSGGGGGYEPSPNANKLQVLDHPTSRGAPNHGGHHTDSNSLPHSKKKGVRFAPSVTVARNTTSCPLAQDEDYASSMEGLSDDGTTTSGSYILSDEGERGVRLGISNEGTVV